MTATVQMIVGSTALATREAIGVVESGWAVIDRPGCWPLVYTPDGEEELRMLRRWLQSPARKWGFYLVVKYTDEGMLAVLRPNAAFFLRDALRLYENEREHRRIMIALSKHRREA